MTLIPEAHMNPNTTTKRKARCQAALRSIPATLAVALLGLCAGATGCGGASDEPVTYKELQPLIQTSCVFSSCHGTSSSSAGSLQLGDANAYCNLIGATKGATFHTPGKNSFPRRVVPNDSAQSFLYKKLTISGSDPMLGSVMPLGQPLPAEEVAKFKRWIDQGAKDASGTAAPAGCN